MTFLLAVLGLFDSTLSAMLGIEFFAFLLSFMTFYVVMGCFLMITGAKWKGSKR